MKVAIRTDASPEIGTGHLMRCLTLADALRIEGADVTFLSAPATMPWRRLVEGHGHRFVMLNVDGAGPGDADLAHASWLPWGQERDARACRELLSAQLDWLVVDHYALDERWEHVLRERTSRVFVVDDLADRRHSCEVLLDQNVYDNAEGRYAGLVPAGCSVLLGPGFALLRPEFREQWRRAAREVNDTARRLLVFFGGSDPTGETVKTLRALPQIDLRGTSVDVVAGGRNPAAAALRDLIGSVPGATLSMDVDDMAARIAAADVGIGACGTASLERCCLGLPSLTVVTADNQRFLAAGLASRNAIILLGRHDEIDDAFLAGALMQAMSDAALRASTSRAAQGLFPDGPVGAVRCVDVMRHA